MEKNKVVINTRQKSISKIIKREIKEKNPFNRFTIFKDALAKVAKTREQYGDTPELQQIENRIIREGEKVVIGRIVYSSLILSTLLYHETYALRLYSFGCIYGAIEFGKCYKREIFDKQIQLYLKDQAIDGYKVLTDKLQDKCNEQEKTIKGYKLRIKKRKEKRR